MEYDFRINCDHKELKLNLVTIFCMFYTISHTFHNAHNRYKLSSVHMSRTAK